MNFDFNDTKARINAYLFKTDIMNTGCVENDLQDEYFSIAAKISYKWFSGCTLAYAVKSVFEAEFYDGVLSTGQVNSIVDNIMKEHIK